MEHRGGSRAFKSPFWENLTLLETPHASGRCEEDAVGNQVGPGASRAAPPKEGIDVTGDIGKWPSALQFLLQSCRKKS